MFDKHKVLICTVVSEKFDISSSSPTPSPVYFQTSSPFPLHGAEMEWTFSGLFHGNGLEITETIVQYRFKVVNAYITHILFSIIIRRGANG
jgi:hypothetical protein